MMDTILQDLRYAARQLRARPGFTAAVVLTLALGIGANTAMFSVVRAVLLRSLPYPDPGRLVVLWRSQGTNQRALASALDVLDWRARSHALADVGIERSESVNLSGNARPDRLVGAFVDARTLRILGAHAELGRLFTDSETTIGSGRAVAVLSDAEWRSRFGADRTLLGRTIVLNGRPHVVIGVTEPGFQGAMVGGVGMDVWLPITSAPNPSWLTRGDFDVWAIGRLNSGVTVAQARRDLNDIAAQLATEFPDERGRGVSVVSLRESTVGAIQPILLILFGFVAVVLVIASVNVANLQLSRALARRRELSVRAALGAGRSRLARQLLTESALLALLGGGAGVLAAAWSVDALTAAIPGGLPVAGPVGLDPVVLLFAILITAAAGLGFGAGPALLASRANLGDALTTRGAAGHTGSGGKKWPARDLFVGVQLALSIVLLTGAGLLARSLASRERVRPGFAPEHIITGEFRLPVSKYRTPEVQAAFMAQALERIRAVPGVRSAALVRSVPLSGNWGDVGYTPDTRPGQDPATAPITQQNAVTDGAFATLRIPLIEGRDFDTQDRAGAPPVAIVNETLARQAWPGTSPLGRRLKLFGSIGTKSAPASGTWVTVVGVVGDVKQMTLADPAMPQLYQPFAQSPGLFNTIVARTDGDPSRFAKTVRAAIWSVDPEQPVWRLRSLASLVAEDTSGPRFTTLLSGAFALLALLLAAVGLYGVTAFGVAQRTQEVGVRIALGARVTQVVGLVLGRALRVALVAAAVGTGLALLSARLLRHQLFDVSAADPVTFLAVPLGLLGVAVLAAYLPARRAARVDPVVALRAD